MLKVILFYSFIFKNRFVTIASYLLLRSYFYLVLCLYFVLFIVSLLLLLYYFSFGQGPLKPKAKPYSKLPRTQTGRPNTSWLFSHVKVVTRQIPCTLELSHAEPCTIDIQRGLTNQNWSCSWGCRHVPSSHDCQAYCTRLLPAFCMTPRPCTSIQHEMTRAVIDAALIFVNYCGREKESH